MIKSKKSLLAVFLVSLISITPVFADVTTVLGQDVDGTPHILKTDANGQLYIANPGSGGGGGTASSVTISDGTNLTRFLAIDATGKIGLNNFPSTFGVTGTFWQSTQPVSIATLPSLATGSNTIGNVGINGTVPVSGSFFQATQPVSILTLPALATGVNTIGNVNVNGTVPTSRTWALGSGTDTVTVVPSGTQAISAASLPLPTGAATSAKQPALGTAGTPSTDVLTVQGAASGIAIKTDGSATTQPISGTVTSVQQPTLGTLVDRSGSITTGGTAQSLASTNASRRYLFIENISSGDIFINFTSAAVLLQPSIKIPSGGSFVMEASFVSPEAISIIGATTGQAFTAKEF